MTLQRNIDITGKLERWPLHCPFPDIKAAIVVAFQGCGLRIFDTAKVILGIAKNYKQEVFDKFVETCSQTMQFVSLDHFDPKMETSCLQLPEPYAALGESEVPNEVLSHFQASRIQSTIDLISILTNMKQLCILFPWGIKLHSSREEERTIALDEGIKAFAKVLLSPHVSREWRCAWAIQGRYLNNAREFAHATSTDEDERKQAGGSVKTKRILAPAATGCLRQLDAAHKKLRKTSGQSRGEGDGRKTEGEEFGITEEDSGGCAMCRSRSR
jgi:hypothetical protein